jgi:multidrug resistance efflux pump
MSDISNDTNKKDKPAVAETKLSPPSGKDNKGKRIEERNPVRRITLIVLAVCLFLFVWCIVADRLTPSTDQADIKGFVVPIAPMVGGIVKKVYVQDNQVVSLGHVLLEIDPTDYELAVQAAQAALDAAGQTIGVKTVAIKSAAADIGDERAQLNRAQRHYDRLNRLVHSGAVSASMLERAEAELDKAKSQMSVAEANLEKAKQQLGKGGKDNPKIRAAVAALRKASLGLARTTIYAPSGGAITNRQVEVGRYAKPGEPMMAFVTSSAVWVQANMRENNIENIKSGDPVDIALEVAPGRIFGGEVVSMGFGVGKGPNGSLGALPKIEGKSGWLRDPQRFPVVIKFTDDSALSLTRIGGQAYVIIYTGSSNFILNTIGRLWIRLVSVVSYVY